MQRTALFAIAATLITFLPATAMAVAEADIVQAWKSENVAKLKTALPDLQSVDSLVKRLYGNTVIQPNVGEYRFADLKGDRTVELIVTIDFSGRGFFNTVNIIQYENGKLHSVSLGNHGVSVEHLKSRVVDLNGDGSYELLIPRALAQYAGAQAIPVINDVYQWNGQRYVKADVDFKTYYRKQVMPKLKAALDSLNHGRGSADPATVKQLKEKYQKEIAEVSAILSE